VHIAYRSVIALAWPFMLNSSVQALLNLTDTWFVGHISTQAVAAMAAVHWLVLVFVLLLGGVGIAVQTLVAQAYGGHRRARAAQAEWTAQWGVLLTAPLFLAVAFSGRWLLSPFDLDPEVEKLALEFWVPRVACAPIGVALWAVLGFFNGIARPHVTLAVTALVAVLNAVFNQIFIFDSAWASPVRLGHECRAVRGLDRGACDLHDAEDPCGFPFPAHVAIAARPDRETDRARFSDGIALCRRLAGNRDLSDHDGAIEQRRWCSDADRDDADVDRLPAGGRHRDDRHDARRPVDRRRGS
jgi:hypothetical protein